MKETDFVDQNKDKWRDLELELMRDGEVRPDKVTHLYIDSIDDLSFARTHYPNRLVRAYLNGAVEVLSLKIQKSQKNYWLSFKKFWLHNLPLALYEGRREFLISFLILSVSIAIGVLSSMHDDTFASYILGEEYVATTLANIEKGDPMAIYKDDKMAGMFFGITINNIMVAARTFILSLFFGFGTILAMVYNGIMLGVFQYFFIERGLFFESFLTIWQHGVIEISCIVLAGAAGLVLAKGILFPGSYSRLDSFRIRGRKSLMLMLGLMPLLVFSGAIEAYVTRFTEVHWTIRLASILMSLSFILFYFVWYPRKVAKAERENESPLVATQPVRTSQFSIRSIQSGVNIFWESVRLLFGTGPWLGRVLLGLIALISAMWWGFGLNSDGTVNPNLSNHDLLLWYMDTGTNVLMILSTFFVVLSGLMFAHWAVFKYFGSEDVKDTTFKPSWKQGILVSMVLGLAISAGLTYTLASYFLLLIIPIVGVFFVSVFHRSETELSLWQHTWQLVRKGYPRIIVVMAFFGFANFLISAAAELLFNSLLTFFLTNFVMPDGSEFLGRYLIPGLFSAVTQFTFVALVYISFHLSYFTLLEIQSARVLTRRIDQVFPVSNSEAVVKASLLRKEVFAT